MPSPSINNWSEIESALDDKSKYWIFLKSKWFSTSLIADSSKLQF